MSRKAREDKTSWSVPSIYGFAGDYGPMKPPRGGIEEALVILVSTLADGKGGDCKTDERRHPMYSYAGQAQSLLLGDHCKFRHVIVVDAAGMVMGEDDPAGALKELMQKELDSRELSKKGFGRSLLRLFQRMQLRDVTLAAEGPMCSTLLKLCDALGEGHLPASDVWLLRPELPPKFVNSVLVPMGQCPAKSNTCGRKDHSLPLQLHLVFEDELARDKRLGVVRHVFRNGTTIVGGADGGVLSLFGNDSTDDAAAYDPDFCSSIGKSLFLSKLTVEMDRRSKQYEVQCEEITEQLTKVETMSKARDGTDDALDLSSIDWNRCERQVGALVLRGNRCVLVRSLTGEWQGMRFPSVVAKPGETATESAIRACCLLTGVEESEVSALKLVSPVNAYAPNGRTVVVQLHCLYATAPPPDGPLEDADMEDDESPYDWYTFENAAKTLDERSIAALRSMASILVEAATVGVLPNKWGGVFGQEDGGLAGTSHSSVLGTQLSVQAEEWTPSRQADLLQDVRKANSEVLSRITSNQIDAGKTTLLRHVLANYDGFKVAILVNDMGAVNIDAALIENHSVSVTQREEHLVEMSNGCICCTLREDLLVEVSKIAAQGTFDYLIIESTGISEPLPVAETFTFEDSTGVCLGDLAQLDTLVTVVDGSRFLSELDSIQSLRERGWHADPEDRRTISHLMCDQVEFANVVVLNKCDMLGVEEKARVRRVLAQMNPTAQLFECVKSEVPIHKVLGTGLFSMTDAEKHELWLKEARIGEHTPETLEYGISSFTYRARKPFLPHKLHLALEAMLDQTPPFDKCIILRSKGFVWLANFPQLQGDFSLAGHHYSLLPGNPWWAVIEKEHWPSGLEEALGPLWDEEHGDRQQEIVIIGKDLDEGRITAELNGCLLADDDMGKGQDAWTQMCADAPSDPFYDDWYAAIELAANELEGGDGHDHSHHHEHSHP